MRKRQYRSRHKQGGWVGAAIAAAGALASSSMASSSQGGANRTNVKLQREQQAWEAMMSNTAVQRRVKDITAAGGNPALAFTNGQSASTPSIASAHVEPRYKGEAGGVLSQAVMMKAQLDNMRSNTALQSANARSANVDADIKEGAKPSKLAYEVNHNIEAYEWDDLKTKITRSLDASSSAQAKQYEGTVSSMIEKAKADARAGTLNTEALENIAKMGGIEAGKMQGVIKLIIDLLKD